MSKETNSQNVMGSNFSSNKEHISSDVSGLQGTEKEKEVPIQSEEQLERGKTIDLECTTSGNEQCSGGEQQQQQRGGGKSNDIDKSSKLQRDGCRSGDIEIEEDNSDEQPQPNREFWREFWDFIGRQQYAWDEIQNKRTLKVDKDDILETILIDFILPSYIPMISTKKKPRKKKSRKHKKKKWFKKHNKNNRNSTFELIFI